MTSLIIGLVIFLGIHSISIVAEPLRNRLAAKNKMAWMGFYSLISALGLALVIMGYGAARATPTLLYVAPVWLNHVALLLLLPVFMLLLAPYFPGKITASISHPQLLGVKIWAFAHLLCNGFLADWVLFGSFFAWAILDRISLKKRTPRGVPSVQLSSKNDLILVTLGLAIYLLFAFWLHQLLIGVAPIPRF